MTTEKPSSEAAAPPAARTDWKVAVWWALRLGARLGLAAVVLYMGWQTAVTLNEMLEGPNPALAERDVAQPTELAGAPDGSASEAGVPALSGPDAFLRLGPFSGGDWEFQDLPWRMSSEMMPAAAVETRLREIPERRPAAGDPPGPFDGEILAKIAESLHLTRVQNGDLVMYSGDLPQTGRGSIIACMVGGTERLLIGRIATKEGPDLWRVCAMAPAPAAAAAAASARDEPHLLPVPTSTVRLGRRRDSAGKSVAELLSVPKMDRDALLAGWTRDGWTAHKLPGKDDFAEGLYCARGPETVAVWFVGTDSDPKGTTSMLLIRSDGRRPSGPAKTGARQK